MIPTRGSIGFLCSQPIQPEPAVQLDPGLGISLPATNATGDAAAANFSRWGPFGDAGCCAESTACGCVQLLRRPARVDPRGLPVTCEPTSALVFRRPNAKRAVTAERIQDRPMDSIGSLPPSLRKNGTRFQGQARRRTATGRQECRRSLGGCIWQVAALGLAPPRDFAASRRKRPAIILPVIILPLPWAREEGGRMMEGKMIPEVGRGFAAVWASLRCNILIQSAQAFDTA
jgi:hypothetical protein